MSKRARNVGGTPLRVEWPPGEPYNVEFSEIVEPNHQLSAEAPAALRDDLIKNHPDFSEVEQSTGSKMDTKEGGK